MIRPSDYVRLFGVTLVEDLSLDRHVSNVCKSCFMWLRQLRRVRRSLDIESVKTLVHAFVTSRVDYYNSVLTLSTMTITDKVQRVLNSAARLITATGKFDRDLSQLLNDHLHWLDVPQRVQYKLALMVHRYLGRLAPSFVPRRILCAGLHRSCMVASICDPPVAINSSFHASVAALSVLVLSPLRAQQFGILCLTVCIIQLLSLVSFDETRKRLCLCDVASHLEH